jgi:hypothetical protein
MHDYDLMLRASRGGREPTLLQQPGRIDWSSFEIILTVEF